MKKVAATRGQSVNFEVLLLVFATARGPNRAGTEMELNFWRFLRGARLVTRIFTSRSKRRIRVLRSSASKILRFGKKACVERNASGERRELERRRSSEKPAQSAIPYGRPLTCDGLCL